jgi:hypothetical protein
MLPISSTEACTHQDAPGEQHRPGRCQGEDDAADGGEDEHADHGTARAIAVEQEAARYLHCGEAEEKSSCEPAKRLRPDRQVTHQVQADRDVRSAKEMAGYVRDRQCCDDDQASAIRQVAPLDGAHRWGCPMIL